MVSAQFDKDMVGILKSLQGEIFSYYMYGNDFGSEAYGNVRIATETFAVDLTNIEKEFPFLGETQDSVEELSCFRCTKVDLQSRFEPYIKDMSIAKNTVGERILSVEIVTDKITISQENYCIAMDMALIIETAQHRYVFSRDWYFSETIHVHVDKDFDAIYPIVAVKDSWNNDGEYDVEVTRYNTVL